MQETRKTTFTTGRARLSYVHLLTPGNRPGQEPRYSVTVLVPKSDTGTKQAIDAAIAAATQDGISRLWGGRRPAQVPTPVYDGDGVRPSGEPFGAECRGHWVFTASSKNRPEVVDLSIQPIIEPTEVYSGMYGRVSVTFFPYDQAGRRGVGCGLNAAQKVADGEPLGGRVTAAEAFGGATSVDPITGLPF